MTAFTAHGDRFIRWMTTLSVVLLAGIAAVISYRHMYLLVLRYEESMWTAALLPLSVDGMIAVSSMTLLADSRNGRRGGLLPWSLLIIGSMASLAANVAVADPSAVGRLIAAWPSCALIGSYELLMRQVRYSARRTIPNTTTAASKASATNDRTTSGWTSNVSSDAPEANASYGRHMGAGASKDQIVAAHSPSYEAQTAVGDLSADVASSAHGTGAKSLVLDPDGSPPWGEGQRMGGARHRSRPASGLQRQAWQWAQVNRTPAGELPSGKEIAARFGRRERWGRLVKQAGGAGRLEPIRP